VPTPSPTATPTPVLDQRQASHPGNTGMDAQWWPSQSFVPTMPILTAVDIYMGCSFCELPTTITLQIRTDSEGLPSDTVLTSVDVTITGRAWNWVNFDVPDISVNPGTTYQIALIGHTNYHVGLDSTDPYPDGHMSYSTDAGATWQYMDYPQNCDVAFKTYGLGTPATPTP